VSGDDRPGARAGGGLDAALARRRRMRRREPGTFGPRWTGWWARLTRSVRVMPPPQLAVRAIILGSGVGALALASGGHLLGTGLIALIVLPAAVGAAVQPGGPAAALVLTGAATAWVLRYGLDRPNLGLAATEAGLLYLHHLGTALIAELGPRASLTGAVLRRWCLHAATVLGLTAAVAAVLAAVGHPAGSTPLELLGVAAAAVLAAALVALSRTA
jgi:hypothetical protein